MGTLRAEAGKSSPEQVAVGASKASPASVKPESTKLITAIYTALLPQWASILIIVSLVFGGCCSNVYALEAIINDEPESGILLTLVQFLFVAATGYISQFDAKRPPFYLRPNRVPIRRWLVNIALFFTINILNNHAFSYKISVPVHIILRSGGSITTMAAGYLYGKKYSRIQIFAVYLLTAGVVTAAWSDAQEQKQGAEHSTDSSKAIFGTGLVVLLVAQVLSAIMGLYTEKTYEEYGPHWRENLFYSHLLSLPLFLPFLPSLTQQFARLAASPPMTLASWVPSPFLFLFPQVVMNLKAFGSVQVPTQLAYMGVNVLTQYICIRGVNLLAAVSSALTVTIVLNIRKLVSLLLSIWLFSNRLALGTLVGAIIVFGSGALYSLDSGPRPKTSGAIKKEDSKGA